MNRVSFAPEEWYHCYNRGIDKRRVFQTTTDYERFLQLLYVLNSDRVIHRSDFKKTSTSDVLQIDRGAPLVAIGAYCMMPNHFHILLKERIEGGISRFMQKLGIAYTMYFNIKNDRVGNLFVKPFRSKHVADDRYFKRVVQYVHLNAAELFESKWKRGIVKNSEDLERKLREYRYSSFPDYHRVDRKERVILDTETRGWVSKGLAPLKQLVPEAVEYYRTIS